MFIIVVIILSDDDHSIGRIDGGVEWGGLEECWQSLWLDGLSGEKGGLVQSLVGSVLPVYLKPRGVHSKLDGRVNCAVSVRRWGAPWPCRPNDCLLLLVPNDAEKAQKKIRIISLRLSSSSGFIVEWSERCCCWNLKGMNFGRMVNSLLSHHVGHVIFYGK